MHLSIYVRIFHSISLASRLQFCAQLALMYDMNSINKLRCAAAAASSTSASPNITDFHIHMQDENMSWR